MESKVGIYRSNDPLRSFKIAITLRKVTAASVFSSSRADTTETREGVELEQRIESEDTDIESCVIAWQEKLFSEREEDMYADRNNCVTALELKYNDDVSAIKQAGGRRNNRIFTYVEHDQYTDPTEYVSTETNSSREKTSYLIANVLNVRQRRAGTRGAVDRKVRGEGNQMVPKLDPVTIPMSTESLQTAHVVSTPSQTMHIMADLSPSDRLGQLEDEHLICTVRADSHGVITVKPDFSRKGRHYYIENVDGNVFDYTVEHVSCPMSHAVKEQESKMFRELYGRHRDVLASAVGRDFTQPLPKNQLRLCVFGEIVSATDFEYDNLYVEYLLSLPDGWKAADSNQKMTGISNISYTRETGDKRAAHFGFPFEFELVFDSELLEDGKVPKIPELYFQVMSLDFWERHRTEGYGHLLLPHLPGVFQQDVLTWRPLGHGVVSEMRRFFIGGSPELDDVTYSSKPASFQGTHMSKYGFRTVTSGILTVRLNMIQQSQAYLNTTQQRQGVVATASASAAAQSSFAAALDAFQRARQRMQRVRESLKY